MITDRQLGEYVEGGVTKSAKYALEASLPYDPVAQRLLRDQLRIHNALGAMSTTSPERAHVRRVILEELGLRTVPQPRAVAPHPSPRPTARPGKKGPKRKRSALIIPLMATCAILVAIAILLLQPSGKFAIIGTLADLDGDISLLRRGSPINPEQGVTMCTEDVLTLGEWATATLRISEESNIAFVGPAVITGIASNLDRHEENAESIRLKVERGEFTASLQPRMREQLTLETPHLLIIPSSGECVVKVSSEVTEVSVRSGMIKVVDTDGGALVVQPGDSYSTKGDGM